MYKTLEKRKIEIEDLTFIIHYVIGILNKFKSKENREIDLKTITNRPIGVNFKIAKGLLTEIKADTLVDNDLELDKHINNLYLYLKHALENKFDLNSNKGKSLLEGLRKMNQESIAISVPSNAPRIGRVKFFNETKGFGFITEEGTNTDHFVHISGLVDEIKVGDEVEFDFFEGKQGPTIRIIKD